MLFLYLFLSLRPFQLYFIHKFSQQLSVFSLCSSDLISALFVLSTICLFIKVSFSPDIIPSGWLGWKHRLTNQLTLAAAFWTDCNLLVCFCGSQADYYSNCSFMCEQWADPAQGPQVKKPGFDSGGSLLLQRQITTQDVPPKTSLHLKLNAVSPTASMSTGMPSLLHDRPQASTSTSCVHWVLARLHSSTSQSHCSMTPDCLIPI